MRLGVFFKLKHFLKLSIQNVCQLLKNNKKLLQSLNAFLNAIKSVLFHSLPKVLIITLNI